MVDGVQERVPVLPDDNPMYSGWGNGGWATWGYTINPSDPDATFKPMPRVQTSSVTPRRVIWPTHRWRGDFEKIAETMPEMAFVAPDGVTIVPETYDIYRATILRAVTPGQSTPFYVSNEYVQATYRNRCTTPIFQVKILIFSKT